MIELPVIDPSQESQSGSDPSRTRFWRSLSQYEGTEEFRTLSAEEFVPGASNTPSGASRRQFIQLMGASMALAGLTACRRPVEHILPFTRRPEDTLPGVALFYATGMPFRGSLRPILVESSEGRPIKVEGNPEHPDSMGASGVFEQASLLDMYDPDRSRFVRRRAESSSWNDFKAFASSLPASTRVAVLAEPSSSMTRERIRHTLESRFTTVRWTDYNLLDSFHRARGFEMAYGRPLRPKYQFSSARVIVSLEADFLGGAGESAIPDAREFAASRSIEQDGTMSRLYVVESGYSTTGAMADNRLRLRSSEIPAFAASLSVALGVSSGTATEFAGHHWVTELARDLRAAGPNAVILAGDTQPPAVHALCAAINDTLGAVGTTVELLDAGESSSDPAAELDALTTEMAAGNVDVLVMLGVNPVYDLGVDSAFVRALSQVPESIHLGQHVDETAVVSSWHVPEAHYLEAWGDGRSYTGVMSVVQPLIAPLYEDAHSDIEVLGLLAEGDEQFGYDMVRDTWRSLMLDVFDQEWRRTIHDGFVKGSGFPVAGGGVTTAAFEGVLGGDNSESLDMELVVHVSSKVLDGRHANNVWLQELPEMTTKIVWDNVLLMSPATAETLGVSSRLTKGKYYADMMTVEVDGHSAELPIWAQPGMADGSIHVWMGYGRNIASDRPERKTNFFDLDDYSDVYGHGAISTGVGANVNPFKATAGPVITQFSIERSGSDYMVATTQDHGTIAEEGFQVERRGLFRMATVDEYRANPDFVRGGDPPVIRENWEEYPTLWQENHPKTQEAYTDNPYHVNQWGMVIDLNTCTGCNACVVACQAENNIQVVGKEEVANGREMHWLRIDRYFVSGDGAGFEEPQMVLQPLPCMHCENAPCEQVCPVAATVHSPDGTNQMIYNRCIGTRYCANNCPYKVRRFNFFNWTKTLPTTVQMVQNPNVTVRSRGVMEKCSYCIQRIREADVQANLEHRAIRDGEVLTACQQACASGAITFGDIAQPDSEVTRKRSSNRRYELLAELNVKPRTSYLGKVRNPNPNLAPRT